MELCWQGSGWYLTCSPYWLLRCCKCFLFLRVLHVQGQVGWGTEQPGGVGGVPACKEGWNNMSCKAPSNPKHFVILWFYAWHLWASNSSLIFTKNLLVFFRFSYIYTGQTEAKYRPFSFQLKFLVFNWVSCRHTKKFFSIQWKRDLKYIIQPWALEAMMLLLLSFINPLFI